MTTTGNGHSRAATSARRRGRRGDVRPGQEPIAALTPDLGPLPPIPVMHGAVLATDPTLVIARLIARAWMRIPANLSRIYAHLGKRGVISRDSVTDVLGAGP